MIKQVKYNRLALKELYDYYYPLLVIHINRTFRGKLDGRDIAHQFFLKLFEMQITEYIKYPASWVYKIAEYIAIGVLRKNGKRKTAETIAAVPIKVFDIHALDIEILDCLEERERKIVYLHYWEDYKLKEIAALLGMNYSTAKSAYKKALGILKKFILRRYINEKKV